jgi:hypothetical protein
MAAPANARPAARDLLIRRPMGLHFKATHGNAVPPQNLVHPELISDFEAPAVGCAHGDANRRRRLGGSRRNLGSGTELVLEVIPPRHQIVLLKRGRTRRPCFGL